jgi:hypothetical protein
MGQPYEHFGAAFPGETRIAPFLAQAALLTEGQHAWQVKKNKWDSHKSHEIRRNFAKSRGKE